MNRIIFATLLLFLSIPAARSGSDPFHSSPYPIPRFVSLGSGEVNVRTGPGSKYPIQWVYKAKHQPVEIILEYDAWRKVKDVDGQEGWVHGTLLSGKRTGIIQSKENVSVFSKSKTSSKKLLQLEPNVHVFIKECAAQWCKISTSGYKGWIERKFIWGVYASENFD